MGFRAGWVLAACLVWVVAASALLRVDAGASQTTASHRYRNLTGQAGEWLDETDMVAPTDVQRALQSAYPRYRSGTWVTLKEGAAAGQGAQGAGVASADSISAPASVAILPPVVKHEGETQNFVGNAQSKFNPVDAFNRVMKRLPKEVAAKRWPLEIIAPDVVQPAFLGVVGSSHAATDEVKFSQLKAISERLNARYVARFVISELTSYRKTNTMQAMNGARAGIDVSVYDHETNEFVWQMEFTATSARGNLFGFGSLSERQDQALLNAMLKTLEPFAKGERKKIGRPTLNYVATVQKVLGDGKRVLLDVGEDRGVSEGDLLNSVESDSQVKLTKVLSNGSLADILKGNPKEKEVFQPAPAENASPDKK